MKIYFPILLVVMAFTKSADAQDLTIDGQFKELIKKSNSYKGHKVVKKEKIYTLRSNVADSVRYFKQEINTLH